MTRARQSSPSAAEIEHCLGISAKCVALHGDVYLPIFQRLERELKEADSREAARLRAIEIAHKVQFPERASNDAGGS